MLLVISGLPGTGKSAAAAAIAAEMQAVHLSIDQVEDAMLGAGLPHDWTTGVAAYEAVRAAAEQNLELGHSVVVDAVNDSAEARGTWVNAAAATGADLLFVVLTPPPPGEHQRRLSARQRRLAHLPEPTWEQVQARAGAYEGWSVDHVVVDSNQPPDVVHGEIRTAVAVQAATRSSEEN